MDHVLVGLWLSLSASEPQIPPWEALPSLISQCPFVAGKRWERGLPLAVQWLTLHISHAGGLGLFAAWPGNYIPHATTKSVHDPTKDPHAPTNDRRCYVPQLRPDPAKIIIMTIILKKEVMGMTCAQEYVYMHRAWCVTNQYLPQPEHAPRWAPNLDLFYTPRNRVISR